MKITPYFSHDSNARNDEKIIALRIKHGWEGYGLYWAINEKLRESTDYRLTVNFNLLAFELRTTNELIKSIVTGFGLYTIEDDYFYSKSLCERMQIKDEASERARQKALKRWENNEKPSEKKKSNATALPQHQKNDAKKVKEVKVNDYVGNTPPPIPPKPPVGKGLVIAPDAQPTTMADLLVMAKSDVSIREWAYRQGIQPDDLPAVIDDFHRHCQDHRKVHLNLIQYQSHIVNWYPKRPQHTSNETTKTTSDTDEYLERRRRSEERDKNR